MPSVMETILVIQTATLETKRRMNMNGIIRGADEFGWRVQTIGTPVSQAQLDKLIDFWKPRGIVAEDSGRRLNKLSFSSVPTVFIDRDPSLPSAKNACFIPSVRNDSANIAELVAKEFLSLGFVRFAFVGWHHAVSWCEEKRIAYRKILSLHGFGIFEFNPTPAEKSNQIAFQKRLRLWLKALPKPCGVFAITDTIGEQVLTAALSEGIPVPQEIAVIGVDNEEALCERTHPTLSSVMPNFAETGYQAVRLLAAEGKVPCQTVIRPFGLVRRQSSRHLPKTDAQVDAALELIRREACNGLRAKDVYGLFSCSRRLAEKRFQQTTGRSVLKTIHLARLEFARKLLTDPHIPVKVVANRCGWNSDIIFRRIYKAVYGATPRNRREDSHPTDLPTRRSGR